MKQRVQVAFARFWPGFTLEGFLNLLPFLTEEFDLVVSQDPDIVFYSVFVPQYRPYADPRFSSPAAQFPKGDYVRVFLTGENVEPLMESCEFAISFSALVRHPNHMRLPLWAYENQGWGVGLDRLIKRADTDWEKVAAEKTAFCNFVYDHDMPFRNAIFTELNRYKRVDAAGRAMNNMDGWRVTKVPNRLIGKLDFLRRYKFTLSIENTIWPGYTTEKIVDPMFVGSIPIYVGDPLASNTFDPASYVDYTRFTSIAEMLEFVREVDNDPALYFKMLAAPNFRGNTIPETVSAKTVSFFFRRIFAAGLARQRR